MSVWTHHVTLSHGAEKAPKRLCEFYCCHLVWALLNWIKSNSISVVGPGSVRAQRALLSVIPTGSLVLMPPGIPRVSESFSLFLPRDLWVIWSGRWQRKWRKKSFFSSGEGSCTWNFGELVLRSGLRFSEASATRTTSLYIKVGFCAIAVYFLHSTNIDSGASVYSSYSVLIPQTFGTGVCMLYDPSVFPDFY